ncbi:protein NETWORKED 3C isoform X2 [Elaeis guineensis]|uniref:Protein NETWORKED 3C isoform X2 n=1 Tax=Elaeis guineensis var. tenera TaxID=51953 RepID=A0A8N4F5U0_ELAGV|nr:protein NETWORKED 3C isoform X2 [Elaeis guineensis]
MSRGVWRERDSASSFFPNKNLFAIASFLFAPEPRRRRTSRPGLRRLSPRKEARMMVKKELPHSWLFDSHNNSRQSPWLLSTLSDLEEKTMQMLKLIDEDADSFAQRAEMFYKKRPQLVNMIEDFYRTHRSLAEQYDQLKSGCGTRCSTSFGPSVLEKGWSQKVRNSSTEASSELSSDFLDSEDCEVNDPEQEAEVGSKLREMPDEKSDYDVVKQMSEELERLKQENATLKAELAEKMEEKREVIRQLSLPLDILKEENADLRKCIKDAKNMGCHFAFKKLAKKIFSFLFQSKGRCCI